MASDGPAPVEPLVRREQRLFDGSIPRTSGPPNQRSRTDSGNATRARGRIGSPLEIATGSIGRLARERCYPAGLPMTHSLHEVTSSHNSARPRVEQQATAVGASSPTTQDVHGPGSGPDPRRRTIDCVRARAKRRDQRTSLRRAARRHACRGRSHARRRSSGVIADSDL